MQNARLKGTPVDVNTLAGTAITAPKKFVSYLPALNVGVSWTSNMILVLGSFIVTPAVLHALGVDWYDRWLLVMTFVGHMRILDLGMTSGCMKFSAAHFEKEDRHKLLQVFNTSVAIFGVSGLLALLTTALLAHVLPLIYPAALAGTQSVIVALGLSAALDLFCRPYAASLRGRSFFFVYDSVEIVTYLIFKLALVLYLSSRGLSLWMLAVLSLIESVIRNGGVIALALWLCNWTRAPNPLRADRVMLITLLSYSGAVFLMGLADLLRFQINAAVIGFFMPDASGQITTYGIGFRLILLASTTIGVVWSVLIPRFSGLAESGKVDELWALYSRASRHTGLLTVFGLVNMGVFGLPFLKLWLNEPWVIDSYYVMLLALPAYFVALLAGPAGGLLAGVGRLKWQTAITIAEALCNVALSIALVGRFGIFGVCLGTAIPMLVFRGIVFPFVLKKETKLPVMSYYREHTPAAVLALAYTALTIGFAFLDYPTFIEFFAACAASTLIFGLLLWFWMPEARMAINRIRRRASEVFAAAILPIRR